MSEAGLSQGLHQTLDKAEEESQLEHQKRSGNFSHMSSEIHNLDHASNKPEPGINSMEVDLGKGSPLKLNDFDVGLSSGTKNQIRCLNLSRANIEDNSDFEDTKIVTIERYNDILKYVKSTLLSESDRRTIEDPRDWQAIRAEIESIRENPDISSPCKKLLNSLQSLPATLNKLAQFFKLIVHPYKPQMELLWGLLYLNIKLSLVSVEKLKRTTEWMCRLCRVIELLNQCLDSRKEQENSEARVFIIEIFDSLLSALAESIKYLRSSEQDVDIAEKWPAFDTEIGAHISDLDQTAKCLNEIIKFSTGNRARVSRFVSIPEPLFEPENPATFPIVILPSPRNPSFYGRKAELERINRAFDRKGTHEQQLCTYAIYGRRGVGKTELALEYAHSNPAGFDAIFWIACGTGLTLRQSFTNIAVRLNLPRAKIDGHHDENQLSVLKWLKATKVRWLMIFNDADKEHYLPGYLPRRGKGAILITSRRYYNFMRNARHKGDTVKPFDPDQSFDLLFKLLGDDWCNLQKRGLLKQSDASAAKEFLRELGGLPFAIQQAALLINNEEIGGPTIETSLELFKQHARTLPEQQAGNKLYALWDMNFQMLHKDARELLSVLSFLSPGGTCIDLFLPRCQKVLTGKLEFCKQPKEPVHDEQIGSRNVFKLTRALEETLACLVKASLIKREGRVITIHGFVQQALNYHQDLQELFDAAVRIVNEAFPKRRCGTTLSEQWTTCLIHIDDAVLLTTEFSQYTREPHNIPRLKSFNDFVQMIGNCAWYLYEVSNYDGALTIIDVGYSACKDRESLEYADLCDTAGICYLDKNHLNDCRSVLETSLRIRNAKLSSNDIEIATSNYNLGNLEAAVGHYAKAMTYFNQAFETYLTHGNKMANQLALLCLCIGRVHFLKKDYGRAAKRFRIARSLFIRTLGEKCHYMAHVHYAFGNMENQKSNLAAAKLSYEAALHIANASYPDHPISVAAHYGLGCVEFKLKQYEIANFHLENARSTAERRSPTRDDGVIARILWMQSRVLAKDSRTAAKSEELRVRAKLACYTLKSQDKSELLEMNDTDRIVNLDDESFSYDALVPLFFR